MKTSRIILGIAMVGIAVCSFVFWGAYNRHKTRLEAAANARELLRAKSAFGTLEQSTLQAYERYYFGDPVLQYSAAKELVRLTEAADPTIWRYMDWGIYHAEIYARASLAAELTGRKTEAQEFRRLAVLAWMKRKVWDSVSQQMIAIIPAQDFEKAESELFTYISRWDQSVREKKPERSAGQIAADNARLQKVADDVRAGRAQIQKFRETE